MNNSFLDKFNFSSYFRLLVTFLLVGLVFSVPLLSCYALSNNEYEDGYDVYDTMGMNSTSLSLIVPLFTKINQTDILTNSTRVMILSFIDENPGTYFSTMRNELGLGNGSAMYHLSVLEKNGYIRSKKVGKYRRYYTPDQELSDLTEKEERVLEIVSNEEGLSQSDIAQQLNLSRQTVHYSIKSLVSKNRIVEVDSGNKVKCYLKTE